MLRFVLAANEKGRYPDRRVEFPGQDALPALLTPHDAVPYGDTRHRLSLLLLGYGRDSR